MKMFSILNEIGNNSHFRTTGVVFGSIGTACCIYVLVAITGYLSFGNSVTGNIVAMCKLMGSCGLCGLTYNSDASSISATIGKAAIVVLVMFSYPLQIHPCRASVDAVLRWRPRRQIDSPNGSPSRTLNIPLLPPKSHSIRRESMADARFAAITTVLIILSYAVAMTVSSLEAVLAYVGSTGSTSISFILPGLFYYKISSPDSLHHQKLLKEDEDGAEDSDDDNGQLIYAIRRTASFWPKDTLRRLSFALAVYGMIVMVTCLITNTFFIIAH